MCYYTSCVLFNYTVLFLRSSCNNFNLFGYFRKEFSFITEMIREGLDSGNFACGIFVDLQKAFDTVDHQILLKKT